jgi:hypothetical protein
MFDPVAKATLNTGRPEGEVLVRTKDSHEGGFVVVCATRQSTGVMSPPPV